MNLVCARDLCEEPASVLARFTMGGHTRELAICGACTGDLALFLKCRVPAMLGDGNEPLSWTLLNLDTATVRNRGSWDVNAGSLDWFGAELERWTHVPPVRRSLAQHERRTRRRSTHRAPEGKPDDPIARLNYALASAREDDTEPDGFAVALRPSRHFLAGDVVAVDINNGQGERWPVFGYSSKHRAQVTRLYLHLQRYARNKPHPVPGWKVFWRSPGARDSRELLAVVRAYLGKLDVPSRPPAG